MVIDHKQNRTIHLSMENQTYPNRQKIEKGREEFNYVEEYQNYLYKQNVGEKRRRVKLRRRTSNLSKLGKRRKKEESNYEYMRRKLLIT